jgi:DTW domain-containing protein YfiP
MSNTGDLVVISMLDTDTDQVAAFEELIGSHGGIGGPQATPLLLYPQEWEVVEEPLVGAPAVHAQLARWLDGADSERSAKAADEPVTQTKATTNRRRRTKRRTPVATS